MKFSCRLGLEPKMMGKILNMSSGRSWVSEVYNPVPGVLENVPATNGYEGGFGTPLMAKVSWLIFVFIQHHCFYKFASVANPNSSLNVY